MPRSLAGEVAPLTLRSFIVDRGPEKGAMPTLRRKHMQAERTAIAALGATVAGTIAVSHPSLIPAMTLAVAVWVALAVYLKV